MVLIIPFIGAFHYGFYALSHEPVVPINENVVVEGVVINQPQVGSDNQTLTVSLMKPWSGAIEVYLPNLPHFGYGDLIKLNGKIEEGLYAGKSPQMYLPKSGLIAHDRGNPFRALLFKVKESLTDNIDKVLPPEKSALLKGILLGERAEFTEEFRNALRQSGTSHIVALSGYNISVIGVVLAGTLSFLWGRRRAFWITIVFIILFVLMTGAEASVIRAAVMGVAILIAERSSRLYSFRNAITLTAALMLVLNPTLLIFNASFELSFAALLGIVILEPFLLKIMRAETSGGFLGWRRSLAETTAAQLGTLPISFFVFGSFAPLAPLANLLVLEFIPATMFFGFITAILGYVSGGLSLMVGWIANMLLGYEIFIINLFGANLS